MEVSTKRYVAPDWGRRLLLSGHLQQATELLRRHGVRAGRATVTSWIKRGGVYGVAVPVIRTEGVRTWLSTESAIAEFVRRVRGSLIARGADPDKFAPVLEVTDDA